jgi:hypothetical protein
LEVALLDASGNATGHVFPTVTTGDLGEFEVSFTHSGPVALVGDGYDYNELTGAVSAGTDPGGAAIDPARVQIADVTGDAIASRPMPPLFE